MYYGSWKLNDTLTFVCNTHNPSNGMANNADAVPSYHVYEDETSTPILTGTMSLLNNPNTIGLYSEQITLSAANGLEKGKSYNIYIRAVVNNVTGTMSHFFQMEAEVDANVVSDKTGYSLSSPQAFDLNGNITGTFTGNILGSIQSVVNPVTAGNVTGSVLGNVNGSVGSVIQPVGINTGTFFDALADKVWDEQIAGHLAAGSVGAALNSAGSAGDPWATILPGAYTGNQAGNLLPSRMPTGTVLVGDKTGFSLSSPQVYDRIGNTTGTITTVLNVTNPVTVGTNNDKTGYGLTNNQVVNFSGTITNVFNVLNPVVAGVVTGSVLGSVGSVVSPVGINTGTLISAIADGVWDEQLSGHQAAGSAGNALSSAGSAGDPWSTPLPGSYTSGQAGHILASRMPTGTVIVSQNQDKTGYFLGTPQAFDNNGNFSGTITNVLNVINPVVAGVVTGSVLGSVGSVVQPVGINTGSFIGAIADGVWDETLAGHLTAGSAGNALNGAGSAGDPWSTVLPGSYTQTQAGGILASRMPTGTVIVGTNQDKTGYSLASPQNINIVGNISGTFVGNLSGSVGSVTDMGGTLLNKIADYILRRPLASARASANGDPVTFRSLLGALSKLVNRWKISGTTLTVYEEDDTTAFETQTLTGTAGADPITEVDTD